MALSYDDIASTTLNKYRKKLTDNVFDGHPLLYFLKDNKRVRFLDGGRKITEQIIHAEGDTPTTDDGAAGGQSDGSYGEWDSIAITPVDTATAADYDWKQIAATIAISGKQELQNSGEAEIVNLLDAKIMQAEETLKNNLSTMLFSSAAATTAVTGLGVLIGDETSTVTTVGGIDCVTDAPVWRSNVTDATAILAADVDLRKLVRRAYNTASKGGPDRVDLVLSGQAAYEQYEEDLMPSIRRTNTKMADAGFTNIEVQGVPWVWDWGCPEDEIYGINSKYLGLVGHKRRWFKNSKFTDGLETAVGAAGGGAGVVDARYSVITAALELTTRNRRRHFRINNLNLRDPIV